MFQTQEPIPLSYHAVLQHFKCDYNTDCKDDMVHGDGVIIITVQSIYDSVQLNCMLPTVRSLYCGNSHCYQFLYLLSYKLKQIIFQWLTWL